MILNEILFSFIETVNAVELEIEFQIAETNFERFEIVQKLYKQFIELYTDNDSQEEFMYDFVLENLNKLKIEY